MLWLWPPFSAERCCKQCSAFFIITLAALIIIARTNKKRTDFDERQILAQGKAYQLGFYTLIICLWLNCCAKYLFDFRWTSALTETAVLLCMGFLVYVGYCIFHDAYIAVNNTPGKVSFTLIFVGMLNIVTGLFRIYTDWQLHHIFTPDNVNLILGITLCIAVGMLLIRQQTIRRSGHNEDEESVSHKKSGDNPHSDRPRSGGDML